MMYLSRYDRNDAFCAALEELYRSTVGSAPPLDPEWVAFAASPPVGPRTYTGPLPSSFPLPSGSEAYHRYRVAIDGFVPEWGLDRLEGLSDGGEYVNDWCLLRQAYPESTPASEFSSSRGWGEPHRDLDTEVHIEVLDAWDPRRERRQDALERLKGLAAEAIVQQLEAIATDAEEAGLRFRDTEPELERHLDWVFELATRGMTVAELAEEKCESEETVARAVSRMARRLRLKTDGWFVTNRTARPDR